MKYYKLKFGIVDKDTENILDKVSKNPESVIKYGTNEVVNPEILEHNYSYFDMLENTVKVIKKAHRNVKVYNIIGENGLLILSAELDNGFSAYMVFWVCDENGTWIHTNIYDLPNHNEIYGRKSV